MAFNPMANFQKYKKIWMASTILLCMVTFVLCSGFGGSGDEGGIGGWLKRIFRGRGTPIAKIDGSSYYKADFVKLKENREMANKFMRHLHEHCAKMVEGYLKNMEELKKEFTARGREMEKRDESIAAFGYRRYKEKLKQPRFFDGSYKLADLVDFQIWLSEADRLGIQLSDDFVSRLIAEEGLLYFPSDDEEKAVVLNLVQGRFPEFSRRVQFEAREATDERITRALRDEFRVQLARLTLIEAPSFDLDKPATPRMTLTPDQWWEVFKKNRNTFDVSLVPVTAEEMFAQIKPPTDEELKTFFEAHKDQVEDVTSDKIGLKPSANRFVVRFLMADPKAPQFKNKASFNLALQVAPPVAWNPMMPPLLTYLNYPLSDALAGMAIEEALAEKSAGKVREIFYAGETFDEDYAYYLLAWLTRNNPQGAAEIGSMVALGAGEATPLFSAAPFFVQQALAEDTPKGKEKAELFRHALAREMAHEAKLNKERTPALVTAIALSEDPWQALPALAALPPAEDRKIPLPLFKDEEWDRLVLEKSKEYIRAAMVKARDRLTNPAIAGNPGVLGVNLTAVLNEFGFNLVSSKKSYTQHEMERAEELKPLKKAFETHARTIDIIEGRTKEKALSAKTFPEAFFFSTGEKHSVEGRPYLVKPWPPDLEAQQPKELIFTALKVLAQEDLQEFGMKELAEEFQHMDPRHAKTEIPLFSKADNPILFWKEETPKEAPLRWVTDIDKDTERLVKNIDERLSARLARAKAEAAKAGELDKWGEIESNIKAQAQEDKNALRAKAKQEIQDVRERTLNAYKLAKASDELAPDMVRKVATALAKTGGYSNTFMPYGDSLDLTGRNLIKLTEIAPWYKVNKGFHAYELTDFTIPKDIPFPREDMAQKLLTLPWLEQPYEIGHSAIDALNKDLYRESKAAFDRLKAEDKTSDKAARIVQVLPNKSRSVYYITVLTGPSQVFGVRRRDPINPPEPSFSMFEQEVAGFFVRIEPRPVKGSPFIDRVYLEGAKEWRETIMAGLHKKRLEINWESPEVKEFQTDSSAP